ncbi:MAG: hypothetical protein ACYC2R_08685 [Burkholderiales bacterium]
MREALLDRLMPANTRTQPVDRVYFLNLVAFSLSHSIIEKIRIFLAYPSLSDYQLTALVKVWEDERREFNALWNKEWDTITQLWAKHIHEWVFVVHFFTGPTSDCAVIADALAEDKKDQNTKLIKSKSALTPIVEKLEPVVMTTFVNAILRGSGAELFLPPAVVASSAFWFALSERIERVKFFNIMPVVIHLCERAIELDSMHNRAWLKAADFLLHRGFNSFCPEPLLKKSIEFFNYVWLQISEKASKENEMDNKKLAEWYSLSYARAILTCVEPDTAKVLSLYRDHIVEARDHLTIRSALGWVWALYSAGHGREAYALLMEKLQMVLGVENSSEIFDWHVSAAALAVTQGDKPSAELHLMEARRLANGLMENAKKENLVHSLPDLAFVAIAADDVELRSKVELVLDKTKNGSVYSRDTPASFLSAALFLEDNRALFDSFCQSATLSDIFSHLTILHALSGFDPASANKFAAMAKMLLDPEISGLSEMTDMLSYRRSFYGSFIQGEGKVYAGHPEEILGAILTDETGESLAPKKRARGRPRKTSV